MTEDDLRKVLNQLDHGYLTENLDAMRDAGDALVEEVRRLRTALEHVRLVSDTVLRGGCVRETKGLE